jgi:hypothetical protein
MGTVEGVGFDARPELPVRKEVGPAPLSGVAKRNGAACAG